MPEHYEIKIEGHLDAHWSERFADLRLTHLEGNETLLSASLPDQAALHGLLELIRDLNLKLISVASGGPPTHSPDKEVGTSKRSPRSSEAPARSTRTTQSCSS